MQLFDYEVLEHCNHCTKGPHCQDSIDKCSMTFNMKLECRSPKGSEIYTDGRHLASKNVRILHRFAAILKIDKGMYYTDTVFPKYRLTPDAFDFAIHRGAIEIDEGKFIKLMTPIRIRKPA